MVIVIQQKSLNDCKQEFNQLDGTIIYLPKLQSWEFQNKN
jgi:hypothetical protein